MSRSQRNAKLLIILLANCVAILAAALSRSRFFVSGGSDAPNVIFGPTQGGLIWCLLIAAATSIAFMRVRGIWLVPLCAVWVLYSVSASHRLVVDIVRNSVRDTYATMTVQSLPLGRFEGSPDRLIASTGPVSVKVRVPENPRQLWVFAGAPLARLTVASRSK